MSKGPLDPCIAWFCCRERAFWRHGWVSLAVVLGPGTVLRECTGWCWSGCWTGQQCPNSGYKAHIGLTVRRCPGGSGRVPGLHTRVPAGDPLYSQPAGGPVHVGSGQLSASSSPRTPCPPGSYAWLDGSHGLRTSGRDWPPALEEKEPGSLISQRGSWSRGEKLPLFLRPKRRQQEL